MPTMNMRQLRDSRKLKAWRRAGKTVELRDRDHVIGRIVPEPSKQKRGEWPDFEARMKEILGDRVLPVVETVIKEGADIERLRGHEFPVLVSSRCSLASSPQEDGELI